MAKWALITGASAGIGREFAGIFAAERFNLVLLARNGERLTELARSLKAKHGVESRVLAKDLSEPHAPREVFETLKDIPISVLVNNAGFGWHGTFAESDLKNSLEMIEVNMSSLVRLTRLFMEPMIARREGRILNVASTAAFQPGPFTAMYYASKAFVFSLSVALAEELAGSGVTVTTLCPGFTRTEFQERSGMQRNSKWFRMMSAEEVARTGYQGMLRGKRIVIPGMMNNVMVGMARRLPVRLVTRIVRRINGR